MSSQMHRSNILVSFDSIIDTDIGLMRLIKSDYNTDFFYKSIVDSPEYIWRDLLNRRNVPNPLSIIMDDETDEEFEQCEELYNQFMEKEYSKILDLSPTGALANIVKNNIYSKDLLQLTVLCKNEMEKNILTVKDVQYHEAIIAERKTIYPKKYEVIAEKNIWNYDEYIHLERNTLLVPDYRFNIFIIPGYEDTIVLPQDIIDKYTPQNEIRVYNAYALDQNLLPD